MTIKKRNRRGLKAVEADAIPPRADSRRVYLAKRDQIIEHLFLRGGLEAREITAVMLADNTLRSESNESAYRVVRKAVAKIRARIDASRTDDADGTVATNEIDALERRLSRLRWSYGQQVAIAESDEIATTEMMTPNGAIVMQRPKWPAGVRQRAAKDAATIATQISDLEIVLASKRPAAAEDGEGKGEGGLTIVESNLTIPELIRANGVN